MKHIKKLKIDIDKNNFEVIPSVQYDSNTRFLHIQLLDGAVPLDITGCSVIISGIKQDGKTIFNSCNIINSKTGFIEAEVTEQMNAMVGDIHCEIKIYDGNGVLTTKKFTINVTASHTSKEIESTGEFKALTKALNEVQNIDNKFSEVNSHLEQKAKEVDLIVERERINNLVSHNNDTDGNSELLDTRVSFKGKTYSSTGEAVREQFKNIVAFNTKETTFKITDGFNGYAMRINTELLKNQVIKVRVNDSEGCLKTDYLIAFGLINDNDQAKNDLFKIKPNMDFEYTIPFDSKSIVCWIGLDGKKINGTISLLVKHKETIFDTIKNNYDKIDKLNKIVLGNDYENEFAEIKRSIAINKNYDLLIKIDQIFKKDKTLSFYIKDILSVINDNFTINIGIGNETIEKLDVFRINKKNKNFLFKIPFDITYIKIWLSKSDVFQDGTFDLFIKTYDNGINNNIFNLSNRQKNIELDYYGLNSANNYIFIEKEIDITTEKDIDVSIPYKFNAMDTISIKFDSYDLLNSYSVARLAVKYLSGEQTNQASINQNSILNFTFKNEESTGIRLWISKGEVIKNGKIKFTIFNFDKLGFKQNVLSEIENIKECLNIKGSFSIIGDSYSTYKDWIPNGYANWYSDEGNSQENNVTSVKDTWWWSLSNETKLKLLTNSSYSGSTICNTGYSGADSVSTSFITRVKKDIGKEKVLGEKPDIIFIFGGTNDSWAGSPIGSLKYSNWTTEDLKSVLPAFCYLIDYLKLWNPHARIINIVNTWLKNEIVVGMKTACDYYGIENLVLVDIEKENGHPNKNGMESIKNQILNIL